MMGNAFYPDEWLDSAYDIPYEQFYQKGMRGIIFDIDNTLVPHGAPADERAVQLFERLRAIGFHTCLLSNNKEARVAPFAGQVGSDYIYKGQKTEAQADTDRRCAGWERASADDVCRGSALYGCVRGEADRHLFDSCKADQSEGRDPDRVKAVSGENCPVVLCEKTGKKIVEVCSRVFLNGLKEACQAAEPDADRSAGNGGKISCFQKKYRQL